MAQQSTADLELLRDMMREKITRLELEKTALAAERDVALGKLEKQKTKKRAVNSTTDGKAAQSAAKKTKAPKAAAAATDDSAAEKPKKVKHCSVCHCALGDPNVSHTSCHKEMAKNKAAAAAVK